MSVDFNAIHQHPTQHCAGKLRSFQIQAWRHTSVSGIAGSLSARDGPSVARSTPSGDCRLSFPPTFQVFLHWAQRASGLLVLVSSSW